METSTNFGFYLPSRDTDDIADINQISDNFRKIDDEVQEKLESGKNLKTINNQSLLGSGNIEIQGGSGEADQKYSPTSPNAQSGIAVAEAVAPKMDKFGEVTLTPHPMPEYGSDYIAADVKLNADNFNLLNNQGDKVFQLNYGMVGELEVYRNINFKENYTISNLPTPSGANVLQAANVEYVAQHMSKERRMKLIADHTVTAEEASEGKEWELSMSELNNGTPLDKIHILYDIPDSTTITSKTTIMAKINGGSDPGSYLHYVTVNKNAYGPFWVEAEKIAENRWRNVRTQINSNITNSVVYANYFLGSVDVIDSILIAGIPFEGINIKVWGRDAI